MSQASRSAPAGFDLDAVDGLLTTTRSVRRRLDLERPVATDDLRRCLEIAQQAPTGSNNRSYRWLVVTDAAKRAALAQIYRKGMGVYARATEQMSNRGFESRGRRRGPASAGHRRADQAGVRLGQAPP